MTITAEISPPASPSSQPNPPLLHVHRQGSGEPLVLLHGLGESHVGWRPVIERLATAFEVIAVDLPGFGQSPMLEPGVAPHAVNLAAAVDATLEQLGIDRYHVAGYSLGAKVAIQLAAENRRVRSVLAISPDGLGNPMERMQGFGALLAGRGMAMALAPAAHLLSLTPAGRSVFFAGSRSFPWQLEPADARRLLTDYADSPGYEAANWASLFDMPTRLNTIDQPTLLVQGTSDPLMAPQILRYLALIPGARLRWLPCSNHVPISDVPDTLSALMIDFFASAPANADVND